MPEPAAAETEQEIPESPEESVEEPTGEDQEQTDEQAPVEGEEEAQPAEEAETEPSIEEREAQLKRDNAKLFFNQRQFEKQQREAKTATPAPAKATATKPDADNFETYEEYNEAVMDWKIEQRDIAKAQAIEESARQERFDTFNERMAKGAEQHKDFIEVVTNKDLPMSEAMMDAIVECESAPDVAYYLGQNPREAFKIHQMQPIAAAVAIARIESKILSEKPRQRTSTNAPGATKPVSGEGSVSKDLKDLTTEEWITSRNKAEGLA